VRTQQPQANSRAASASRDAAVTWNESTAFAAGSERLFNTLLSLERESCLVMTFTSLWCCVLEQLQPARHSSRRALAFLQPKVAALSADCGYTSHCQDHPCLSQLGWTSKYWLAFSLLSVPCQWPVFSLCPICWHFGHNGTNKTTNFVPLYTTISLHSIPNTAVEWLAPLLHIREVPGSNIYPETDQPVRGS
jgi:hypothetical protein